MLQSRRDPRHACPGAVMPTPRYEIGDQVFHPHDDGFEHALAAAHAHKQRVVCLCSANRPEMYVARWTPYILKRMPGTGSQHDPRCASYEAAGSDSGLGELLGGAIEENEQGDEILHLDFSLSKQTAQPQQDRTPTTSTSAATPRKRLSLRAFLHYLWDRSGLTRWDPSDAPHKIRGWNSVYDKLHAAIAHCHAKGSPLADRLYIPEPFDKDRQDAINTRRQQAFAVMRNGGLERTEQMVVVGELKEFTETPVGYSIVIKHMATQPLLMDAKTGSQLKALFKDEIAALFTQKSAVRLVLAMVVCAVQEFQYLITKATLMMTDRAWIPVDSASERAVSERLVAQQRLFLKPLQYQSKAGARFPNFVLLDAGPEGIAMDILSPFLPENDKETKLRALTQRPPNSWLWDTTKAVDAPPFPPIEPRARIDRGAAQHAEVEHRDAPPRDSSTETFNTVRD